jgi:hypothetical protein
VVRFNATTLWHIDAAEWAPSTASFSTISTWLCDVRLSSGRRLFGPLAFMLYALRAAASCNPNQDADAESYCDGHERALFSFLRNPIERRSPIPSSIRS